MRLWNGAGRAVDAKIRSHYPIVGAKVGNLLEEGRGRSRSSTGPRSRRSPNAFATFLLELDTDVGAAAGAELDPTKDDSSPTAYWLENLGEGVTGNGAVGILPAKREVVLDGPESTIALRIANHRRDGAARVDLKVLAPQRFEARIEPAFVAVKPNEIADATLTIRVAHDVLRGTPSLITILGTLEDGRRVTSGVWVARDAKTLAAAHIEITNEAAITTGGASARLYNKTDGTISARATWISPVVAWLADAPPTGETILAGLNQTRAWLPAPPRGSLGFTPDSWRQEVPPTFSLLRVAAGDGSCTAIRCGAPPSRAPPSSDSRGIASGFARGFPTKWSSSRGASRGSAKGSSFRSRGPTAGGCNPRKSCNPPTRGGVESWGTIRRDAEGGPIRGTLTATGPGGERAVAEATVVPQQNARAALEGVRVDGDLSEWDPAEFTAAKSGIGSVRAAVRHGAAGLAFAFEVDDDQHYQQESGSTIWRGDSIQLALSATPQTMTGYNSKDLEFGAALGPSGPVVWCWYGGEKGADRAARGAGRDRPPRHEDQL